LRWVVAVTTILLVVFGVWPNRVLDVAQRGSDGVMPPSTRVLTD
jgi:hypothetical protein